MDPVSVCAVAGWIALHVGGLALAWFTRVAVGSRLETAVQLSFFVAMMVVGLNAAFCHLLELGYALPSGITLILMVLTAVTDVRRTYEPVPAAVAPRR